MSIDPAARVNCKDFGIVFLRTAGGRLVRLWENAAAGSAESLGMKTRQQCHRDRPHFRNFSVKHCHHAKAWAYPAPRAVEAGPLTA
jgi:hypothetical protein